jgi:serine protease
MTPTVAGHGMHTAGLVAGNSLDGNEVDGVCRHCGVGIYKISEPACFDSFFPGLVSTRITPYGFGNAIGLASESGVQIVNSSFGRDASSIDCTDPNNFQTAECSSLAFARDMDIVVSAASGNDRIDLQFPASDLTTAGIGGLDEALQFWDESPGSFANCPPDQAFLGSECGSNYTATPGSKRQELTVPGRVVRSLFYTGQTWNASIGCSDASGDGINDGVGLCTGTSMAAPIASGLFGLLRSINPLMNRGDPESPLEGVRDVVVRTTDRSVQGLPWDAQLGYGRPDAAGATRAMLGTVRGSTARNRVTPLFALYSAKAKDYASVATPQLAITLLRFQTAGYLNAQAPLNFFIEGSPIPGYGAFPPAAGPNTPPPRANAFVLTTEFSPVTAPTVPVTPLYLMDRRREWPLPCAIGGDCKLHRDQLLLTSITQLEAAVAAGYQYLGYQGYVLTAQGPGSEALYLQCNTTLDDCAVFMQAQRAQFEAVGYTALFPGASTAVLGYAYPPGDTDADGLVDGMEWAIGSDPFAADSDGDGKLDSTEYPQASLSGSDPCDGANVTCLAPRPTIFSNGFE